MENTDVTTKETNKLKSYICRVCFQTHPPLFGVQKKLKRLNCTVKEAFRACTPFLKLTEEVMSDFMCRECILNLRMAYIFNLKVRNTEKQVLLGFSQSDDNQVEVPQTSTNNVSTQSNETTTAQDVDNNSEQVNKYVCTVCQKRFNALSKLKTHALRHVRRNKSTNKPYGCKICGESFMKRWRLLRHKTIHIECKTFACDLCAKTYSEKGCLTWHKAQVHKFDCEICRNKFDDKKTFIMHTCLF